MQKLTGTRYTQTEFLLAAIADRLSYLVWFKTEDGAKNRNRPKSFVEEMTGEKKEKNNKPMAFNNGDDLKAALARFEEA